MDIKNQTLIATLISTKELSESSANHKDLLKDKSVILYVATILENKNLEIVNLCLDILSNLIGNVETHNSLLSTFGMFEALESLTIKSRSFDKKISERAAILTDTLRKRAPPAYSTRLRTNGIKNVRKTNMYQLHIEELNYQNRPTLDETLVAIKGIISFVVDVEQRRCTIRIGTKVTIVTIISKILSSCGWKAKLIKRNSEGNEVIVDLDKSLHYDYFPDVESPPSGKKNVYYFTKNIHKQAGGFLKSAVNLWNQSFYW